VIHEKAEGARLGRARLGDDDVLAVGRPRRRHHDLRAVVGFLILADRSRIRSIRVGDPEILDASPISQEGDRLAVRRIRRLALERQAAHEPRGLAAVDR
jgi:hypothetical protein